jgi:hypothetical protein
MCPDELSCLDEQCVLLIICAEVLLLPLVQAFALREPDAVNGKYGPAQDQNHPPQDRIPATRQLVQTKERQGNKKGYGGEEWDLVVVMDEVECEEDEQVDQ